MPSPQSRGHQPAGTKPRNQKVRDPMDPKVALVVDEKPILPGDRWRGAYFLFDMAAELWLEEQTGKPISYFDPSAPVQRMLSESLLWYIAGLRHWHKDGMGVHSAEDDLKVTDLARDVTQKEIMALSYTANQAWAIVMPKEMTDAMREAQKITGQREIIAGLTGGADRKNAVEDAGILWAAFLEWMADDPVFRGKVEAAERGEGEKPAEEAKPADPLPVAPDFTTGLPLESPSGSATPNTGD